MIKIFNYNILYIFVFILKINNCEECDDKTTRRIDGVVAKLVTIGNSGRRFPESKGAPVKKFCDDSKSYITQIENYKNNCLKDLPKQATAIMVYSIKVSINSLCKGDTKKLSDLVDSTVCMNNGVNDLNKCYTKYIDAILGAKYANDSRKIPLNCCSYFELINCSETHLRQTKGCTDKYIETGMDFLRNIFSNVIQLICGDYTEGSDLCKNLGPAPPKKKSQRRSKSFMMPLLDLFSSFRVI